MNGVFSYNNKYITKDGKPYFPVMGEFHYSRYPAYMWEKELMKMKAGGVDVVSSYVIWIHHEEIEGQYDFTGSRDLRRFVKTCEKCGIYMFLRIGPWSHAEARNGGFPDWLIKKHENVRTNDESYLADDDFYTGEGWTTGLARYGFPKKFEVEIYPLFKDDRIYLEHTPEFDDSMKCEITSADAFCEYVFDIEL